MRSCRWSPEILVAMGYAPMDPHAGIDPRAGIDARAVIDSRAVIGGRRRLLGGVGAAGALAAIGALADAAGAAEATSTVRRMPVLFIGHGSPMNLVRDNAFTQFLRALGPTLPKPTAILSVSAHWLTPGATAVGIQEKPETIHDFGGFPPALSSFEYPARGAPMLALQTAGMVRGGTAVPTREWGLDHGTWTVLHRLFPAADVPVYQLSI